MDTTARRPWRDQARPAQLPPESDWRVCLAFAGRGWGKTWAASNWIAEQAALNDHTDWVVVAPTWRDVSKVCVPAIVRALQPDELACHVAADASLILKNGSRIHGFSADGAERLRGGVYHGAWLDELDSFHQPRTEPVAELGGSYTADQLRSIADALDGDMGEPLPWPGWVKLKYEQLTEMAQIFVSTSQAREDGPGVVVQQLLNATDGSVVVLKGTTWDNESKLSATALACLRERYGDDDYRLAP